VSKNCNDLSKGMQYVQYISCNKNELGIFSHMNGDHWVTHFNWNMLFIATIWYTIGHTNSVLMMRKIMT
jgi:hypothetical protein